MDDLKLSASEIARCITISRALWGGSIAPREARREIDGDRLLTSAKVLSAIKRAEQSGMFGGRSCGKTLRAEMSDLMQVSSEVLDWIRNHDLGAIEHMLGGKTLKSVARQYDKKIWAVERERVSFTVEAMENAIGAERLRHLLTLRT